jgi:hypothetical protein
MDIILSARVAASSPAGPSRSLPPPLDPRIREIIRAAGLADADHDHPEYADRQHEHYDLAGIGPSHDFTHDHFGEYADAYHVHQQPWG